MKIVLGDVLIDLTQKEIKNVHLSVNPPKGDVRISAPFSMNIDAIRAFAISKIPWIKFEQKKFLTQERESLREYLDRESHYVWGQRYMMEIVEVDNTPAVELKHSKLVLHIRPNTTKEKCKEMLETWYRMQIKIAAPEIIKKYSSRLQVNVERLYVQGMKTRWGGANPARKSIRLNTDLARKPSIYLDYVVLHEMVHFIEPTHNARFSALMDLHMPNWKQYRDELNKLPLKC
nr:SprT family zinc-dependent metalloprotease [Silvanigrella paludirubra]